MTLQERVHQIFLLSCFLAILTEFRVKVCEPLPVYNYGVFVYQFMMYPAPGSQQD